MSALNVDQIGEGLPGHFSISLIMQQSPSDNPWLDSRWSAVGIVSAGGDPASEKPAAVELMQERDGVRLYLHRGFTLRLHADECESYYHNLLSPSPCAYVVASLDDSGTPQPSLISLSFDEAHAYLEGDEDLYTVPLPPEIYQWTEAFVLAHYLPEKRTKRQRQDWTKPMPGGETE
jgi:hypothetical protein